MTTKTKTDKRKSMRNGYVTVYAPEHPKAAKDGHVYEHFIVAEKAIGRYIREGEHVHHLDLNELNNRPENLIVLEHGQHTKLHNYIRRHDMHGSFKVTGSEGYHVKECRYCDEYLIKYDNFCDKECHNNYLDNKRDSRPSKKAIEMLLYTRNKVEVGKIFGVHRTTINSWLWR